MVTTEGWGPGVKRKVDGLAEYLHGMSSLDDSPASRYNYLLSAGEWKEFPYYHQHVKLAALNIPRKETT